jgi:chromosome condensin MukBEF ATPase and DNA-binding subunit MukB
VKLGAAWRLTRHPERPVVGRAARKREIDRLRAGVDQVVAEIEAVRAEVVRFQEGLKTIAVLSRYYRFLGAVDPGESVNRLQNHLNNMKGEERRNLRRTEEVDLRLKHCRWVLHELTSCLPDANLLDDPNWRETLDELQQQQREAGALKDRMDTHVPAMERVRSGWLDLEHPPPGPELVQGRRQALELAEAVLDYWSRGRELLAILVGRLPWLLRVGY